MKRRDHMDSFEQAESRFEVEYGKVGMMLVLAVIAALLIFIPSGDRTLGIAILTTEMGYIFGNGRLASKGKPTIPAIGASKAAAAQAAQSVSDAEIAELKRQLADLLERVATVQPATVRAPSQPSLSIPTGPPTGPSLFGP